MTSPSVSPIAEAPEATPQERNPKDVRAGFYRVRDAMQAMDLPAMRAIVDEASKKLSALCNGERWHLAIPVQATDTDMVLGRAIDLAEKLIDDLAERITEADSASLAQRSDDRRADVPSEAPRTDWQAVARELWDDRNTLITGTFEEREARHQVRASRADVPSGEARERVPAWIVEYFEAGYDEHDWNKMHYAFYTLLNFATGSGASETTTALSEEEQHELDFLRDVAAHGGTAYVTERAAKILLGLFARLTSGGSDDRAGVEPAGDVLTEEERAART